VYENTVMRLLEKSPEWQRCGGCDHVVVLSRIARQFESNAFPGHGRTANRIKPWIASAFRLSNPFWRKTNVLTIEALSSQHRHLYGVPYPTFFHPASDAELASWLEQVGSRSRKYMITLAVGFRSHRKHLITTCKASPQCNYLDCGAGQCGTADVVAAYLDSDFCIQPKGDSDTRRGVFDSALCGCIPVTIVPGSLGAYPLYLGTDTGRAGALLVPEPGIIPALLAIDRHERQRRRLAVMSLIPNVTYGRLGFDSGALAIAFRAVMTDRAAELNSSRASSS
jgi:hypothetical protein